MTYPISFQLKEVSDNIIKKLKEINVEICDYHEHASLIPGGEYDLPEFSSIISFACKNLDYSFSLSQSDTYFDKNKFNLIFYFNDKYFGTLSKSFYLSFDNYFAEVALIIDWIKNNGK